jgi:uncharacterized membrane protein YeaQ/YmgE (transglycosylase-associated protein family)
MMHMIVSAIVHGVVYGVIRETMHGLGVRGIVAYVVTGLIAAVVLHAIFRCRRYRRR